MWDSLFNRNRTSLACTVEADIGKREARCGSNSAARTSMGQQKLAFQ